MNQDNFSKVKMLYELTKKCLDSGSSEEVYINWYSEISNADAFDLVALTGKLSSIEGKESRDKKALREAIISEIGRKNAYAITETMKKLDRAATLLTWVSIILSIIGIFLAILQFTR